MLRMRLAQSKRRTASIFFLLVGVIVFLAFMITPSRAVNFQVNSFLDTDDTVCDVANCTLREAINAANATPTDDIIDFAGPGTIVLGGDLPALAPGTGTLVINGGGAIVIDGNAVAATAITINSDGNSIFGLQIQNLTGSAIIIDGGANNIIGGTVAGQRNLIFDNGGSGILITGAASIGNTIVNNVIGTNALGIPGIGNAVGVNVVNGANGNFIGTLGGGNIISGNVGAGVVVTNATTNTINGNFIGTNLAGTAALTNGTDGVLINAGSSGNFVNGNILSGNTNDGLEISGGATTNTISGNFIGLDVSGNLAVANGAQGINLIGAINNQINNNTIAGNTLNGVLITNGGVNSSDNIITANVIGRPVGNGDAGIRIANAVSSVLSSNTIQNNAVGIFVDGSIVKTDIISNTILSNTGNGVTVINSTSVELRSNSIVSNGGLGIDLGNDGITLNDLNDPDVGANTLQNFPLLNTAISNQATQTTITGSLNSLANSTFRVEFYANTTCDPTNFGEGERYLGASTIVTNGAGNANFSSVVGLASSGEFITAFTVDINGNTSEFAACIPVAALPPVAAFTANPAIGNAPLEVFFTDQSTGAITSYFWDFGGGVTSTLQNPSNLYINAGTYNVILTVAGPGGSDTATATIFVTAPLPTATFTTTVTSTQTASATTTSTVTNTATSTATNTATVTATSTATSTNTATATATVTASATSTNTATLTATNTATATVTASSTPTATVTETRTPLPTATFTATPTGLPDLEVDENDDEDGFDIIVQNNGPGDANNVTVIEQLQAGVRYISSVPGAPVCVENRGVVVCELGTIESGGISTIDMNVSSNGADPSSGQTTVSADGVPSVVIEEPYIFKVGQPPVAAPGELVTYTIRIINPTNSAVTDVVVEDVMPEAMEILSVDSTAGNVTVNGQNVTFTQSSLVSNGRTTITIETRVREDEVFAEIINNACLTSSGNSDPSCASMSFLRASQLPSTGETPRYRQWVLFVLMAIGGSVLLLGGVYQLRRNT